MKLFSNLMSQIQASGNDTKQLLIDILKILTKPNMKWNEEIIATLGIDLFFSVIWYSFMNNAYN